MHPCEENKDGKDGCRELLTLPRIQNKQHCLYVIFILIIGLKPFGRKFKWEA